MLVSEVPFRMSKLKLDPVRGVPVPWFVAWVDGSPEFRIADGEKMERAIRQRLCWVCGQELGRYMTFVIGPMCVINRTTSEPPCHLECAQWSAENCPFLNSTQPNRREKNMPEGSDCAGVQIRRNPHATALWTTRKYSLFDDGRGGILFNIGESTSVEWWSHGRKAKREEVMESVDSGLPILRQMAEQQEGAVAELERRYKLFVDTLKI